MGYRPPPLPPANGMRAGVSIVKFYGGPLDAEELQLIAPSDPLRLELPNGKTAEYGRLGDMLPGATTRYMFSRYVIQRNGSWVADTPPRQKIVERPKLSQAEKAAAVPRRFINVDAGE